MYARFEVVRIYGEFSLAHKIIETYITADGPRSRLCDGVYRSFEEAEDAASEKHEKCRRFITKEQLNNGFAGLSILVRDAVLRELEHAQRDTSVEYHRSTDPTVAASLWTEIQDLNALIESIKQVSKEFKEVAG